MYLHISTVCDPLGQLLRGKANPLKVKGVCSLRLPFGWEMHEGGGRVHVQLEKRREKRKKRAYEKMSRKHKRRREGRRMMNRRETRAQKH